MAHIYRELIGTRYLLQARVFDGIEELLAALRRQGYLLSTASLKRADYCSRLLADKGLLHLFHAVAGQNAQYALTKCQVVRTPPGSWGWTVRRAGAHRGQPL